MEKAGKHPPNPALREERIPDKRIPDPLIFQMYWTSIVTLSYIRRTLCRCPSA